MSASNTTALTERLRSIEVLAELSDDKELADAVMSQLELLKTPLPSNQSELDDLRKKLSDARLYGAEQAEDAKHYHQRAIESGKEIINLDVRCARLESTLDAMRRGKDSLERRHHALARVERLERLEKAKALDEYSMLEDMYDAEVNNNIEPEPDF